jgi:hypothetical protein
MLGGVNHPEHHTAALKVHCTRVGFWGNGAAIARTVWVPLNRPMFKALAAAVRRSLLRRFLGRLRRALRVPTDGFRRRAAEARSATPGPIVYEGTIRLRAVPQERETE